MIGATVVGALCFCLDARAQTPQDETRRLAGDAEQRIRDLQREADRLAAQSTTVIGALRALELEREIRSQAVKKAQADLAGVASALEHTSARLTRLEAQRLSGSPGVNQRLVEVYKRGRGGYARLLLSADDLRAFGRLSRGVAGVARLDRVRFDEHRRTVRSEQEAIFELATRKTALTAAHAEATKARQALEASVAAHNRRIDDLDQRRDLAARYVGELQDASAALQRRVSDMTSGAATPAALPLAPFRGTLEWPLSGRVMSRFGRSPAGHFNTTIIRNGIEIAPSGPGAREVRAVHGGTVAFAAPFSGFGALVIVDHGAGAFTLYGHLLDTAVAQGARLERGAIVGRSGRNPEGIEALYFEVRIDGQPVDPVQWLRSPR